MTLSTKLSKGISTLSEPVMGAHKQVYKGGCKDALDTLTPKVIKAFFDWALCFVAQGTGTTIEGETTYYHKTRLQWITFDKLYAIFLEQYNP